METLIGNFQLTNNQQGWFKTLRTENINGVSYKGNGDLIIVSQSPLSPQEIDSIKAGIQNLPNTEDPATVVFTKARIKAYIQAGATIAEKVDRVANVLAVLASQIRESDLA